MPLNEEEIKKFEEETGIEFTNEVNIHDFMQRKYQEVNTLFGLIETVTAIPTHAPKDMYEQFKFYTDDASVGGSPTTNALYFYSNKPRTWHKFTETVHQFGGDGSDGAFSASSGTTTLDFGGAKVLVKNYTSFDLTGTAILNFQNPHDEGSTFILRCQGNVNITTSNHITLALMGGAGGLNSGGKDNGIGIAQSGLGLGGAPGYEGVPLGLTAGAGGGGGGNLTKGGDGGVNSNGRIGGVGGASCPGLTQSVLFAHPGGGGSGGIGGISTSGGNFGGAGGAGKRGGGGMVIECRGAYNFTTGTIISNGEGGAGGNGSSNGNGGGGGSGAGGSILVVYGSLTANSGTYNNSGNAGGAGGSTGGGGTAGAGGTSSAGETLVVQNTYWN